MRRINDKAPRAASSGSLTNKKYKVGVGKKAKRAKKARTPALTKAQRRDLRDGVQKMRQGNSVSPRLIERQLERVWRTTDDPAEREASYGTLVKSVNSGPKAPAPRAIEPEDRFGGSMHSVVAKLMAERANPGLYLPRAGDDQRHARDAVGPITANAVHPGPQWFTNPYGRATDSPYSESNRDRYPVGRSFYM